MLGDPIVQKKKKNNLKNSYVNPYEVIREFGEETKQQTKEIFSEVVHELFALPKKGDLQPGQELDLKSHKAQQQAETKKLQSVENHAQAIRPGIDYIGEILRAGEKNHVDEQKTKQEIQEVILELKSLASSTKQLEKEIVEATGQTLVSPGKYHKSFFNWVLSVVRDARQKIDNASVWLTTMNGKQKQGMASKKKKPNYWDMAKKHGTKFSLSGERAIATQAG